VKNRLRWRIFVQVGGARKAQPGEVRRDDLLLPRGVARIETQGRRGEVQLGDGAIRVARGEQAGGPAGDAVQQAGPVQAEPEKAQAVGSVHQALLSGILVQWLVDPDRAPSAGDLTSALRTIAEAAGAG
jgi:hypothetical protein